MDVQSGRIFASSPGGDGGGDEQPGDCADIRAAPGHGAQNASLLGAAGLSPAESAKEAQGGALHRRYRPDPGGRLGRPKKQRHTAKRIFERLRDEYGYDGGYTTVKDNVRENRRQTREMFVPLSHPPGHAQCDFGEAPVVIGGVERKAHCFVIDLPHSDGCFVKAYPAETTEAFMDGHVSAFTFLGGVPRSILYDNTSLAVAKILGDGRRQRTRAFTELQSHYLFDDRFGRDSPSTGWPKGTAAGARDECRTSPRRSASCVPATPGRLPRATGRLECARP